MRHFPAFHDLNDRPCLVVGGRRAAARKVRLLRKAGAAVTVIAPELSAELAGLAKASDIAWLARRFRPTDADGNALVIAATGDDASDAAVSADAMRAGVPVNVVDRPDLSNFITPSIIDRGAVVIGISSGGASPSLARHLRGRIEALLPGRLGRLARFAERFRGAVKARVPAPARREFWDAFIDGPIAAQVLAGEEEHANRAMLAVINRPAARPAEGTVAIVGAGPGDADLLTLRALRLLQRADVIVYDRLVGDGVLDLARRDAERIFVGKATGRHAHTQDDINALMADHARQGRRVVRLKGGDPFVFGRGGEEVDYLRRHGIASEIVPGVTAAAACAASAGIPLTHRGAAQAVTLLTGHAHDGEPDLDWAALARLNQTLAIYMGVATAGAIAARLIEHGLAPSTPVAIIENGTLPNERVLRTRLDELESTIRDHGIRGPAMILIGAVVDRAQHAAVPAEALAV